MRANFHRREGWSECAGYRVPAGRNGDSVFPLCRVLVGAGVPDQPLEFFDERGRHCFTVDSIVKGARSVYAETDRGLSIVRWLPMPRGMVQNLRSNSAKDGKRHSSEGVVGC